MKNKSHTQDNHNLNEEILPNSTIPWKYGWNNYWGTYERRERSRCRCDRVLVEIKLLMKRWNNRTPRGRIVSIAIPQQLLQTYPLTAAPLSNDNADGARCTFAIITDYFCYSKTVELFLWGWYRTSTMRTSSCLNPKSNYTTSNCPQQKAAWLALTKEWGQSQTKRERRVTGRLFRYSSASKVS